MKETVLPSIFLYSWIIIFIISIIDISLGPKKCKILADYIIFLFVLIILTLIASVTHFYILYLLISNYIFLILLSEHQITRK